MSVFSEDLWDLLGLVIRHCCVHCMCSPI